MIKSTCIPLCQHSKQKKNSSPEFFFVICIEEVKRLVLSIFTLTLITHSLERNTQTSFAYERRVREKVSDYLLIDKAVPGCLNPISANLVLNFNLDFFIPLFESLFQIISSVPF